MSSTTSKRLKRIWSIVNSAHETGAAVVTIAYLEAALEGGEKWARLEDATGSAPLPPEEYRAMWADSLTTEGRGAFLRTPNEYEVWYDQEMDRIDLKVQAILSEPDAVL